MSGRHANSPFNARGPQPMKYGKAAKPVTTATLPRDSWWIGLSRDEFDAELARRDRTLGGDFRHESGNGSYAPEVHTGPRRKRQVSI